MKARRQVTGLLVLVLLLVPVGQILADQPQPVAKIEPTRICFGEGCQWPAGLNLPWNTDVEGRSTYGHDFGQATGSGRSWTHDGVSNPASRARLEADFAYAQSVGAKFLRVFLFCDGRASPEFDSYGRVTGFDEYFYPDLFAALQLAQKYDLRLILVLLDYHWLDASRIDNGVQLGGHKAVINDPQLSQSFIDNALVPMLQMIRLGGYTSRVIWEVINEPEWRLSGIPGFVPNGETVPLENMQAFVQKVARYIHQNSSQLVTLGSAKSSWLYLWKEYWFGPIGLDFFQAHYYDWMGANEAPFVPVSSLNLDRPVLVGEFPTKGTSHTISQYLEASWNNGYCGALAWSLNGGDGFSDFPAVATEFQQWLSTHQLLVPWPHRIFLPTLRRQ